MSFRSLLLAAIGIVLPLSARGQQAPKIVAIPTVAPLAEASQVPAVSPPLDLSTWVGRRVSRVSIVLEGTAWTNTPTPPIAAVRPGDVLTPSLARRALQEALDSGRFAGGQVSALSDGDEAILQLRLVPRKLIGRLRLNEHGARLDPDEILREAGLSEDGEIVGADLDRIKERIRRFFATHGFRAATVRVDLREMDDPMKEFVVVDVNPGPPLVIDETHFYVFGAPSEDVVAVARGSAPRPTDRADEAKLAESDSAVAQALAARGWFRATVTHDLVREDVAGDLPRVVLRIRIDTGPLFVMRFDGNERYDADTLAAVLGTDADTDRSLSHLADKIRLFYAKRGFLDTEVSTETREAAGKTVQTVVFHVVERSRVQVASRSYPCLRIEAVRRLDAGGPRSPAEIGTEIDSYLDEELPGADLFVDPDPRGLDATIGEGAGQVSHGSRPVPTDLQPNTTFLPDTYARAILHVQELYRNEGFLHADVGPIQVLRARCRVGTSGDACVPEPTPTAPSHVCTYDASGLPSGTAAPNAALSCRPDAQRGIECAPSVELVIPVRLGPRTRFWDIAFSGVHSVSQRSVAEAADLPLGEPASTTKLEDARRRIVDWYKELGYYYVDVKYGLEPSLDNTRARARFDVVEGERVIVRDIVVRGLERTSESVVRRRFAIAVDHVYRPSDARTTEERIATLGVFSSVTVSLSEANVPQARKDVLVDVVERPPQYIELRPGFSTGEGVRGVLEYGHRNLLGDAWGVTIHVQASYLPDFLILDPGLAQNYESLNTADRIATRDTLTFSWPEVGLGPTVRAQLDGIYVRDLERDFTLLKQAVVGTLFWRPSREVQLSFGPSYERNDVNLFGGTTIETYLMQATNQGNTDLERLLRVPDGKSNVVAESAVLTWDRRDNAFNAHRGTYMALGVEQVNSYPVPGTAPSNEEFEGHFLRLTQTLAAYLPIGKSLTLASELRLGEIRNLAACKSLAPASMSGSTPTYCTYPDRQFYMGGFDSMRGWLQDSLIPQDLVDQIRAGKIQCLNQGNCNVVLRGGNLMINPRFELRFPIRLPVEGTLFGDFGNLWTEPSYVFDHRLVRADVGAGIRVDTPVGPLVFDYGINATRHPYEDFGAFHFAIGLF
jgi:outer membrane protein assembly factor BamA